MYKAVKLRKKFFYPFLIKKMLSYISVQNFLEHEIKSDLLERKQN